MVAAARDRARRWRPGWRGSTSSTRLPDEASTGRKGSAARSCGSGERRAILLAKLLHGVTIPALALFGYGRGLRAVVLRRASWSRPAILAYEHQLVRPGDLSRLDAAFFTMNGVMSRDGVRLRAGGSDCVSDETWSSRRLRQASTARSCPVVRRPPSPAPHPTPPPRPVTGSVSRYGASGAYGVAARVLAGRCRCG